MALEIARFALLDLAGQAPAPWASRQKKDRSLIAERQTGDPSATKSQHEARMIRDADRHIMKTGKFVSAPG
jgi:hypothetical protein